ncbi:MAG: sodium:calcium antiporter [Bacteroidetes bacterium]|nr:sodium:calcium antiporter [Bacteroidota bacterium]
MMGIFENLTGFLVCASVIVFSGIRLAKYGDMLADMLGWGKMFVGLILMASVTSLPELMTGIGSVVVVDAPDLAVADVIGSCVFNILIISILDLFYNKERPITNDTKIGHIISATFSIIQLSFLVIFIAMPEAFGELAYFGHVSSLSIIILIMYLFAMSLVYNYDKRTAEMAVTHVDEQLTINQVGFRYAINALVVMIAAIFLPYFGEHLSEASGLGQSFFGTLFISASTSLPEIVVSVAAIRMGMVDMAVGNLFGSNLFNMLILGIDDAMYTKGPIVSHISKNHMIPAVFAIVITCIGIIGIIYKSKIKWKLAIDTACIMVCYIVMLVLLYFNR